MSQNHGTPSDHILGWHCIEHSPSILHAATFCIHVNWAIPHNDIRLTTTHEKAYHLQVLQNQHMHCHLNKREFVKTHSFSLWLLDKLNRFLRLPILHIFCKLLIPCKNVELHCAWCHCSNLCCHPWQESSVLIPEYFLCHLMFEIQVPFICWQPEIQIRHLFSASHTSMLS